MATLTKEDKLLNEKVRTIESLATQIRKATNFDMREFNGATKFNLIRQNMGEINKLAAQIQNLTDRFR